MKRFTLSIRRFSPILFFGSLPLAQVDIQDPADQEERDAQPCQDETVAKASFAQVSGVV